jgi:hypothetical protein
VILKVAASVPIEPGPYSLRELLWMARAAQHVAWDHTTAILCQQANINRGKGKRAMTIADIHPYMTRRPSRGMTTTELHQWRGVFGDKVQTITVPSS